MIISLFQGLGSWSEKKKEGKREKNFVNAPRFFVSLTPFFFACPQLSTEGLERAS